MVFIPTAILIAAAFVATFFVLTAQSDRQARAVLIQDRRKSGLKVATADPQYYHRLRAQHTSRRVPQVRTSRFARFGL